MKMEKMLGKIREGGGRITKARSGLIRVFGEASRPLTVKEMRVKLRNMGIDTTKTTVYREMSFMMKNGLVKEVNLYPEEKRYESAYLVHHHHLVCEKCGRVEGVGGCRLAEIEQEMYRKRGFRVTRHSLEFYGLCVECNQGVGLIT